MDRDLARFIRSSNFPFLRPGARRFRDAVEGENRRIVTIRTGAQAPVGRPCPSFTISLAEGGGLDKWGPLVDIVPFVHLSGPE